METCDMKVHALKPEHRPSMAKGRRLETLQDSAKEIPETWNLRATGSVFP